MLRELCGETSLKNVLLVTNMWGEVSHEVGEARERELASDFLKPALDKGAHMVRHHNTEHSAHEVIRRIMNNHPVVLKIQRELVDEHKDIANTSAGEVINEELKEVARRHEAELKKAQEEQARALRQKEEEARWKRQEEARKWAEQMRREEEARASQRRLEKEQAELAARRLEEQARIVRQRAEEEERQRQAAVALRNEQIAAAERAAEAQRVAMQQQILQMQSQINQEPPRRRKPWYRRI